jgi:SNF2 family DNA or RNA helicase
VRGRGRDGFRILQELLQTIMLRRTKNSIDLSTGQKILDLPPKSLEMVYVDLDPNERIFYDTFAKRSQELSVNILRTYATSTTTQSSKGSNVLRGYAALFTLLMRLRQICDHPLLVVNSLTRQTNEHSPRERLSLIAHENAPQQSNEPLLSQFNDQFHGEYLKTILRGLDRYLGNAPLDARSESESNERLQEEGDAEREDEEGNIFDRECVVCLELLEVGEVSDLF